MVREVLYDQVRHRRFVVTPLFKKPKGLEQNERHAVFLEGSRRSSPEDVRLSKYRQILFDVLLAMIVISYRSSLQ